jgi:hypothetical protein
LAKETAHGFQHYEPGEIISEENYFALEGMDVSGNIWTSKKVWVNGTISFPAAGKVINTSLNEVTNVEEYEKQKVQNNQTIIIVCPGKYNLPSNEKEDLPGGGWKFNRSVFKANGIDFDIKTNDDHMIIIAKLESNDVNDDLYINIIESLSIIIGKLVHPIIVQHYHKFGNTVKIKKYKQDISNKEVNPPFRYSSPDEIVYFSTFLEKYIIAVGDPHSELFGFWYKINRAWQADIENISLTLTVSIEGLSKKYFSQYGFPDEEIIAQSVGAKKIIEESAFGERISQRLLANLENLNLPSPKSILYDMSKDSIFPKKFAETWVKLRNKSAHAAVIDPDRETFQKHLDRINICLTLFYNLLFLVTGYQGKFIHYSQKGWPDNVFDKVANKDK